jgi:hypothetical protein
MVIKPTILDQIESILSNVVEHMSTAIAKAAKLEALNQSDDDSDGGDYVEVAVDVINQNADSGIESDEEEDFQEDSEDEVDDEGNNDSKRQAKAVAQKQYYLYAVVINNVLKVYDNDNVLFSSYLAMSIC